MPLLTASRSLAVGTLLGPLEERKVNWYLERPCVEILLGQLSPHLDKIAQVIHHYAVGVRISLTSLFSFFLWRGFWEDDSPSIMQYVLLHTFCFFFFILILPLGWAQILIEIKY